MNIMCAFHTYDKLVVSLKGREDRTGGVLFMANNFIRAGGERHKSFKALIMKNSESLEKWYLWNLCLEMR